MCVLYSVYVNRTFHKVANKLIFIFITLINYSIWRNSLTLKPIIIINSGFKGNATDAILVWAK